MSVPRLLKGGERMEAPDNAACSQEMYIHIATANIDGMHVLLLLISLIHSYKTVMQQCWHGDPDQRPIFSQLRDQINSIVTTMAGYLEISTIAPCFELDQVYMYLLCHI